MPTLSSGLVIAGAYADKIRRTLFAQLKDHIRKGEITAQEVARAAGELNRILYEILVDRLRIDKGDVVRVRIEYDIVDNKVKWNYNSLNIEVFRRENEGKVSAAVRKIVAGGKVEERIEKVEEVKPTYVPPIADIVFLSKEPSLVVSALKDGKGENLGFLRLKRLDDKYLLDVIIVEKGKAYRAKGEYGVEIYKVLDDKEVFIDRVKKLSYEEIPVNEAKKIIGELLAGGV